MFSRSISWALSVIVLLVLAGLACNFGGGEEPADTPQPDVSEATEEAEVAEATEMPPEEIPTDTPEPEPSNAITSLDDLENAVIQIVAEGSFVDPEFGQQLNAAGSGSGFIIDEEGIAVTNNHVVTGAALLKVYFSGASEPVNARVLGVSECSDLAVIDLEGGDYPYLEWYDGPLSTGLDVFAAGFPLGDPQFTLTKGIIAKEQGDGETWWASIDQVLMHDAIINPGNSGGPLVNSDGQIVGVNYGVYNENQYMAIARDEALGILEQLRENKDVTSIGVNGSAVYDDAGITGIWVSSVESGSPADQAGIREGDIITKLEGLVLATDGTMADYCDILRSHTADDTLSLEVLRYNTSEVLEGQINGNSLVVAESFAEEVEEQIGEDFGTSGNTYLEYVEVVDDTGSLVVEVPVEWSTDVSTAPLYDDNDEFLAAAIEASSNLEDFWNTYSTPGVGFYSLDDPEGFYDAPTLLDELAGEYEACTYDGRYDYDDGVYIGQYDLYIDCSDDNSVIIELAASPQEGGYMAYLVIQAISDADLEAMDHVLSTFYVFNE
jgi:serine protease Do